MEKEKESLEFITLPPIETEVKTTLNYPVTDSHSTDPLPVVDPFPYGWRYVLDETATDEESYKQVPLTLEDILNPQLGDKMPQSNLHHNLITHLESIFQQKYQQDPHTAVYCDMKMFWGIPNLLEPSPDIAIIPNVKNKNAIRHSFKVKKEGTKPCLVIEIVSPRYPGDHDKKVKIYQQAGIEEYIIIDPSVPNKFTEQPITGYRLINGQYKPIIPNKAGEILSKTTNIYFTVDKSQKQFQVKLIDANIGQPLLSAVEAHRVAEAKADELEKQLKALQAKLNQQ